MKNRFINLLSVLAIGLAYGQVGINTDSPKATMDVAGKATKTSADGLIAPRITRAELSAKRAGTYGTEQAGTIIYVSDISGGSAVGATVNVTAVGYYYFDGRLWQTVGAKDNIYTANDTVLANRIANLDGKTIAFTNTTGTAVPNQFSIDDNTFSVDALNDRVGIGTATPNARLDIRSTPASTNNPGEGMFGIGTTSTLASVAGAGAMRYSTLSGGIIEYSNGITWNTFTSTAQRATVIAKKTSAQSISNGSAPVIADWVEITDTTGDFNPLSGTFTAPRTGNYIVSFSFNFTPANVNAGSQVEAHIVSSLGAYYTKKSVVSFPSGGNAQGGATVSFAMYLQAGEQINPAVFQNTGTTRGLRVGVGGSDDGFVNFSVAEL